MDKVIGPGPFDGINIDTDRELPGEEHHPGEFRASFLAGKPAPSKNNIIMSTPVARRIKNTAKLGSGTPRPKSDKLLLPAIKPAQVHGPYLVLGSTRTRCREDLENLARPAAAGAGRGERLEL